ncbi:MAG: Hsp70 family protein, partial [Proteobacteria bacterium]|nr:Hsp70 family protein [Pseudomonadota bacterium]
AVLEQAGLRNVRVVPESRAAFLHARESRELSESQLLGRILLIDIGSSTTDFTFSQNLNARPVDYGHTEIGDVGGGLLDQAILDHAMASQANQEAIHAFLERNPGKRAELDLKCRDAKHEYFNEKQGTGREVWHAVRLERGLQLEIALDDAAMDRIKTAPLAELGGRSFIAAFLDRLAHVKDQIGPPPDSIIITGGAARMQFIVELINATFPGVQTIRGTEPELAVAKGLAWFGRSQLRSQAFQAEVEALIAGPQIDTVVRQAMETLFARLAQDLGAALINTVLRDDILAWRNGSIATLQDMEVQARQHIEEFLQGDTARALVSGATQAWFEEIRPQVQSLTDPICLKYRLPTSILEIVPDTHFSTKAPRTRDLSGVVADDLDQVGTVINAVVATVSGMVLGGAGVALLHLPVLGHVLTGLGVFVGLMIGKEAMREQVKSWTIPVVLRRLVTEGTIDAKLRESLPDLVSGLRESLESLEREAPPGRHLADRITAQIGQGLRQRGDDAILQF